MYQYRIGQWETREHIILKIKEMTTEHIANTINYLKTTPYFFQSNTNLVRKKIEELEKEFEKRKGIRGGDYIKIKPLEKAKETISWAGSMNKYAGKILKISYYNSEGFIFNGYYFDYDAIDYVLNKGELK